MQRLMPMASKQRQKAQPVDKPGETLDCHLQPSEQPDAVGAFECSPVGTVVGGNNLLLLVGNNDAVNVGASEGLLVLASAEGIYVGKLEYEEGISLPCAEGTPVGIIESFVKISMSSS